MARAHYSKLAVDGIFGEVSVLAWQIYMRVRQGTYKHDLDGKWGGQTTIALQRWMQKYGYYKGYKVDGIYGIATRREMARMMNGKYSGAFSGTWLHGGHLLMVGGYPSPVAGKMQQFLNYYRFA